MLLREGESEALGVAEAQALLKQLRVSASQLVAGAYVELMRVWPTP